MKHTIYLLLLMFMLATLSVVSQENCAYIIFTSRQLTGDNYTEIGVYKSVMTMDSEVIKSPTIWIEVVNPGKNIREVFLYADYDVEKLKASRQKHDPNAMLHPWEILDIRMEPRSFLNTITDVLDLDQVFPHFSSRDYAQRSFEPYRRKIIYMIDRNDMTTDSIKLIGTNYIFNPSF